MRAIDIIAKKRDGAQHVPEEIRFLVEGYTRGTIPDYQLSAWLMAVVWRGLTDAETFALTASMAASGDTLDLGPLAARAVDKHSTGGVGDKTSLAVVPILAAAGVPVAKMSGRGLGHTGGTLDKLESIPGFRVRLSVEEILTQVRTVGACLCAQTERLVPADRKLYALRDATATVESLPLIAASVMSKKLASGAKNILLDVKVGAGAFMKTEAAARVLADLMIRIGQSQGRRVAAVLSDMNAPLGRAVGNALEVSEVASLLQNQEAADTRLLSLVRHLCAVAFTLAGKTSSLTEGAALADAQLSSGAAWQKWQQIVTAQGGADTPLPHAPVQRPVTTARGGYVTAIDAAAIGLAVLRLGAGRAAKDDAIDPAAGIIIAQEVGARITPGDLLAVVHAPDDARAEAILPSVADAFTLAEHPSEIALLIYDTLGL